jgi:hypothetical protein
MTTVRHVTGVLTPVTTPMAVIAVIGAAQS